MATTELVPQDVAILLPAGTVQDGQAQMARFQQECAAVLTPDDWQGPPGQSGSFVKKSGWRKLAMRYQISCEIIARTVERDEDGTPVRADATVRAIHKATGQSQDADGYCALTERRFDKPAGRLKVENDLRGTATTRAKNRAISDLIGYGQVSAEEVNETPATAYGPAATSREISGLERAIGALYDAELGDLASLQTVVGRLEQDAGGYIPRIVARAVMIIARLAAAHRPSPTGHGAGADVEVTPESTPEGGSETPDVEEVTADDASDPSP